MLYTENGDKLTIDLLGNSYDKSFELSLIDIEADMVELPSKGNIQLIYGLLFKRFR